MKILYCHILYYTILYTIYIYSKKMKNFLRPSPVGADSKLALM